MSEKEVDRRLGRIEEKVDQLSEIMVALAKFEEKANTYEAYKEGVAVTLGKYETQIAELEIRSAENTRTNLFITRLFWIALSAAAAIAAAPAIWN